jgi:hypothetical protein
LIVPRESELDDEFVAALATSNWTPSLKSVALGVPGWTQKPRALPLTEASVNHLSKLPMIKEISNLSSWSVDKLWMLGFMRHLKNNNVDLKICSSDERCRVTPSCSM